MKTYRNLFDRFASFDNLALAYRAARRGKRQSADVARFELEWESEILAIRCDLLADRYQFGRYRRFTVREPKERLISAAPFRDRVVHHALVNVLEPIYESRFIHDTYACREDRGTHRAVLRCQEHARRYRYVLKADVSKFYQTVDHEMLLGILRRQVRDKRILSLLKAVLAGYDTGSEYYHAFQGDDLFSPFRARGIPIGNLTSQFFANIYLGHIDSIIKREMHVQGYVRYMDDMLLFSDDREQLRAWRSALRAGLADLRLLLHPEKCGIINAKNGIPFLGFRVFPQHRLLLGAGVRRFVRRTRKQIKAVERGNLEYAALNRSIRGWISHAEFGDSYILRRTILSRLVTRGQGGRAEPAEPGVAGRLVEQRYNEPPLRRSQQQRPDESQQQHRVPVREDDYCLSPARCGGPGRA